jgi:hypothetical protein
MPNLYAAQQFSGTCFFNVAVNALLLSEKSRGFLRGVVDDLLHKTWYDKRVASIYNQCV